MKKISSGISGFDQILGGGLPKNRSILITGSTGTGKSIFSTQFLYKGALLGEPGVLVTLEERPRTIRENMLQFGWDLKELEKQKLFAIIDASAARVGIPTDETYVEMRPFELDGLLETIKKVISEIYAERLVVDSLNAIALQYDTEFTMRRELLRFISIIEDFGCTALFTTETEPQTRSLSKHGIEEYIVSGVVQLLLREKGGKLRRSLLIHKMRGVGHSLKRHPFEITSEGIVVYPEEEVY